MSPFASPHQYLSIHIPKTAGVSIRNILKEHFGPGFVLYYWQITDAAGRVVDKIPPVATCIHGHYQTDHLTRHFPEARLSTWVRDPVERVVSSYYHQLRDPDPQNPICRELLSKKLSLVDYAALPLMRNEMTRYFGSKRPEDFHFIGIVEEFDQSLSRMASLLGLRDARRRLDNSNPQKLTERYMLDGGERQDIHALNHEDVRLYERCRAIWGNRSGPSVTTPGVVGN